MRAGYPDNALEHPKRVSEMPINPSLYGNADWNASTQVAVGAIAVAIDVALAAVDALESFVADSRW